MGSIDVFRGSINENRVRPHSLDDLSSTLGVCPKAKLCGGRILIEMRSQMNYDIVVRQDFKIPGVEYVAIRAAREVIGTEKPAHMDA